MMTFKVGDRVRFESYQGVEPGTGTIAVVEEGTIHPYGVHLDRRYHQGHTVGGVVRNGYGWYFPEKYLSYEAVPYSPTQIGDTDDDI